MSTFDQMMKRVMVDRPARHWLYRSNHDPILQQYVKWLWTADRLSLYNLCNWAIDGSILCQSALETIARKNETDVMIALMEYMDDMDERGICSQCHSSDICGCSSGHCPACDKTKCEHYACVMHVPGAKKNYLATIHPDDTLLDKRLSIVLGKPIHSHIHRTFDERLHELLTEPFVL